MQKERRAPSAELRGIQNTLAGMFLCRTARARARRTARDRGLFKLGDDYLRSYVRRILAVTPEQVRNAAATFLVPDRMQLIVVGDKKIVEQQLAPFGK